MVVLTAMIYTISTLPANIYLILTKFIKVHHPSTWFHIKFIRIGSAFIMINIMANFYIYCLTIRSFRRFLLSRVQYVVSVSFPTTGNTADQRVTGNALFYLNLVSWKIYCTLCCTVSFPSHVFLRRR